MYLFVTNTLARTRYSTATLFSHFAGYFQPVSGSKPPLLVANTDDNVTYIIVFFVLLV